MRILRDLVWTAHRSINPATRFGGNISGGLAHEHASTTACQYICDIADERAGHGAGELINYRGFAIPVGPKSVLFFKIGTLEKKLWFCKVHVLKSGDGAGVYPRAGLVLGRFGVCRSVEPIRAFAYIPGK